MGELATLGVVDYVVFSSVLAFSFLIGILSTLKSSNSANDFLTASRSMHYLPVGCSLITSYLSSIGILGMSGDAYANGIQLYIFVVGSVIGIYITTHTSLPVFSALNLTSMNEYTQKRFQNKALTNAMSLMFIIKAVLYMGVCLYAPTIALSAVTSVDLYTYIYVLGVICTVYSSIGGMRGVVWTDVFQMVVMGAGLLTIAVLGCIEAGGLTNVWNISTVGNRTDLFNFNLSPLVRHTFWNTLLFGIMAQSFTFGIDQLNIQRIATVPTERDAKKLLMVTGIGMVVLYVFVFLCGLIAYTVYYGCDPITLGIINKKEKIVPYFIMDRVGYMYGLPGLFVATLFSGTLSSLSSAMNAVVAMLWKDFLEHLTFFRVRSTSFGVLTNRLLSVVIGLLSIGIAVLCSKSGSLVDLNYILASVCMGPAYGVFLLGLLFPSCDARGAWAGLISSFTFILWISIGSRLYSPPVGHLEYSIDLCNTTEQFYNMSSGIYLTNIGLEDDFERSPYMLDIYNMSYTLYPVLTPFICLGVGLIITYALGKQDIRKVSPELISPFVRKRYWTTNLEQEEMTSMSLNYKSEENAHYQNSKLIE